MAEQRALISGSALVDLSHRDVVRLGGPDRHRWLSTLSTQVLHPGTSQHALLLSVQGRVEFDLRIKDDGEQMFLDVEPGQGAPLVDFLTSMKFMFEVEVEDVSGQYATLGSAVAELPESLPGAVVVFRDPWPKVQEGGANYSAGEHPEHEAPYLHFVRREDLPAIGQKLGEAGLRPAGIMAWEALRIAAWQPRVAKDVDAKTIPHELDLLRTAVHLTKGCYKGQETVARVHNLGHPPRRLTFLYVDGSPHGLPREGSDVFSGDKLVGKVTSVANHHEMGPIALAVLKRSIDAEATLVIRESAASQDSPEEYAASQEVVVRPDSGKNVERPQGFMRH